LEYLDVTAENYVDDRIPYAAITALRQAIEQAQQAEPVAYIRVSKTGHVMACAKTGDFYSLPHKTLLYTSPPPRQPLTDEEIKQAGVAVPFDGKPDWSLRFARAIEAAHGIKENT
jgi:hypothetical protein